MPFDFGQVLVFLVVAVGFVFSALLLSRLVAPRFPNPDKSNTYECGERPVGPAWFNFNPRFYIVALIFVIFDVEIALTFPVAAVFRDWVHRGVGWLAFAEISFFVVILASGLAYVWRVGDLEWLKPRTNAHAAATADSLTPTPPGILNGFEGTPDSDRSAVDATVRSNG